MIQIQLFQETLVDLINRVNKTCDKTIMGLKIGVHEGHLTKKLKDAEGVWLCANYPDAELHGDEDRYEEKNKVILFLVEKVPSGQWPDSDELLHYAKMQRIMQAVKRELMHAGQFCGEMSADDGMRTEWEYDIFGGFNGLSLGLNMTEYDTTIY